VEGLGSGAGRCVKISVNGEIVDPRGATTVAELVECFGLAPKTILIEHNGMALHRRDWPQQLLAEGDQIEFVRVVAGG
jgi:thiamine biosynthesis protein ThiS